MHRVVTYIRAHTCIHCRKHFPSVCIWVFHGEHEHDSRYFLLKLKNTRVRVFCLCSARSAAICVESLTMTFLLLFTLAVHSRNIMCTFYFCGRDNGDAARILYRDHCMYLYKSRTRVYDDYASHSNRLPSTRWMWCAVKLAALASMRPSRICVYHRQSYANVYWNEQSFVVSLKCTIFIWTVVLCKKLFCWDKYKQLAVNSQF